MSGNEAESSDPGLGIVQRAWAISCGSARSGWLRGLSATWLFSVVSKLNGCHLHQDDPMGRHVVVSCAEVCMQLDEQRRPVAQDESGWATCLFHCPSLVFSRARRPI